MNKEEIKKLPKVDLHCHLDGSLRHTTVSQILQKDIDIKDLQVSDDCDNLTKYLEKFNLPLQVLQTANNLSRCAYDLIEDAAAENVKYIEVRFAPQLCANKDFPLEAVVESALNGMMKGGHKFGVYAKLILCLMRHHDDATNLEVIKVAKKYLDKGVCAIDLAGDEIAFPMNKFNHLFDYANSINIPFTIHAGEQGNVENIKDSINCGAKRIGHGIAMRGNNEVKNIVLKKNIGIELCPISNIQTKAVKNTSEYPINEFLENNILVTVNTDNRTVSNTSITKEIEFIQNTYNVSDENIIKLMKNAINISFAPESVKTQFCSLLSNINER